LSHTWSNFGRKWFQCHGAILGNAWPEDIRRFARFAAGAVVLKNRTNIFRAAATDE